MANSNKAVKSILSEKNYTLQLIKGKDFLERPFYAYVIFNAKDFKEMKSKPSNTWHDMDKHGVVIYKGTGHEPTKETTELALYKFQSEYLKH